MYLNAMTRFKDGVVGVESVGMRMRLNVIRKTT